MTENMTVEQSEVQVNIATFFAELGEALIVWVGRIMRAHDQMARAESLGATCIAEAAAARLDTLYAKVDDRVNVNGETIYTMFDLLDYANGITTLEGDNHE